MVRPMKLLALAILVSTAGAAYAALQPADTFDGRENISPGTQAIQFYTPPVMLYGKPIPPAVNAEMPEWAEMSQPIKTE